MRNTDDFYRILEPGKVHFDYGPVSMVLSAGADGEPLTDLCCGAFEAIDAALREITDSLPILRLYAPRIPPAVLKGLPRRMLDSVLAAGDPLMTPMAAVAGAVADAAADWLFARGADQVLANNGGDIALRLGPGKSVKLGIVSSLARGDIDQTLAVAEADGIGGVATSGLGGRSFTRGIAQGLTAFARSGVLADALATRLANASFIPSPRIYTGKAGILDPGSDIADLEVVIGMDRLSSEEVRRSLDQVRDEALRQKQRGNLLALRASVQGEIFTLDLPGTNL
ncbi:MAG: hypothetical protein LBP27_05520 [Treponema sp.]|jgi:ApbE superfamily uncharacterized protein (UPF0280 family)|nr:hypothetical protein [Treponema sp.]